MYGPAAKYYDALYSFKDYEKETGILVGLLEDKAGGSLLDVACGTGKHLEYLRHHFDCQGLDLDPTLLQIAGDRLPGVPLHAGDMTAFQLGERFDVVTCLFSAIGFVVTVEKLHAAIACMAGHLKARGILIVEPWFEPHQWKLGHLHALFVDEPDLKIARMSESGFEDPNVSAMRFEYLVSTRDGIERITEMHRLGLFTSEQYLEAFRAAGLSVSFLEHGLDGRGLYVGKR